MRLPLMLAIASFTTSVGFTVFSADPDCSGETASDVLEKCSDPGETCDANCGPCDSCDGYWTLFPPAWHEPDIRKVRQNESTSPRNCLAAIPNESKTTICNWAIEDCYEMQTCYLDTDPSPDRCERGQQCGGTFTADYTSTSSQCRRDER